MKNKNKRILAIFLSLCITASAATAAVAMPVSAAEANPIEIEEPAALIDDTDDSDNSDDSDSSEGSDGLDNSDSSEDSDSSDGSGSLDNSDSSEDSDSSDGSGSLDDSDSSEDSDSSDGSNGLDDSDNSDGGDVLGESGNETYAIMVLSSGWTDVDGIRYYYDGAGNKVTGWQTIGGKKYYFDANGAMKKSWQTIGGKKYYLGTDGVMRTGWQTISGKKYYLGTDGAMRTGWQTISGKKYYLGTDGVMRTGWQTISSKKYYLGTDGAMKTGWQKIDGKYYYLPSGVLFTKTGFQTIDGKKYYFNSSNVSLRNWQTLSGKKYYFGSNGVLRTGKQTIDGKTYYFGSDGVMKQSGWVTTGGKRYYFKSDGKAATGWTKINGYRYWFSSEGVLDEDVRDRSDVGSISHIVVSLAECTVTVIGRGADGVADIPMKKFICSPGLPDTPTPTGTYYANKYGRWVPLMGPSWGQYGIHVVSGIFFHSIACTYQNVHNVPAYAYSQLGRPASHGCIRMQVGDIKWLYDNIGSNTRTVITNSTSKSVISYFAKPSVPPLKTTNGMNWDPTDPVAKKMFEPVGTVSGLKASTTTDSVKLTWNKVSGANGYIIYRRKADDSGWTRLKKQTGTSYTDSGRAAGTKYKYAVKAYKVENGTESYGKYPTLTTATKPKALTGLSVSGRYPDYLTLKWNKCASTYYVSYRVKGTSAWTTVSTKSNSYSLKNLKSNTEYEISVKGYVKVGSTDYTGTAASVTDRTAPNIPDIKNFRAESTTNSVTINWDAAPDVTGYMFYRRNAEDTAWVRLAKNTSLSYTDTDVQSGTQYKYAVKAYKKIDGKDYYSRISTIALATKPEKVTGVTASEISGNSVTLTWDAAGNARGYLAYYRKAGTSAWTRFATTSKLSATCENLEQKTDYQFRVVAYQKANDVVYTGEKSEIISASTVEGPVYEKYRTTVSLNYRSGPGTSYAVKGTFSSGATVSVEKGYSKQANGYTWYKVKVGSNTYYVANTYLKKA